MSHGIPVGMPLETRVIRNGDATQNEVPRRIETV